MTQKPHPQPEQEKKPYATPQLTLYGDVEELTRGGASISPNDANSSSSGRPVKKAPGAATPTRKP